MPTLRLLLVVLLLSLAACNQKKETENDGDEAVETTPEPSPTPEPVAASELTTSYSTPNGAFSLQIPDEWLTVEFIQDTTYALIYTSEEFRNSRESGPIAAGEAGLEITTTSSEADLGTHVAEFANRLTGSDDIDFSGNLTAITIADHAAMRTDGQTSTFHVLAITIFYPEFETYVNFAGFTAIGELVQFEATFMAMIESFVYTPSTD